MLYRGSCHCGAVEFELALPGGLRDVRRCDCSLCRRRGAVAASVPLSGIRILKGEDQLTLYQFNTRMFVRSILQYQDTKLNPAASA